MRVNNTCQRELNGGLHKIDFQQNTSHIRLSISIQRQPPSKRFQSMARHSNKSFLLINRNDLLYCCWFPAFIAVANDVYPKSAVAAMHPQSLDFAAVVVTSQPVILHLALSLLSNLVYFNMNASRNVS